MNDKSQKPVATVEILKHLVAVSGFAKMVGAEVIACEDGFAELSIDNHENHTQHHGFLHGGLVGFLADSAMSWAAASVAGDVLTSEYKLHLLSPGKGEKFIGRGHVIKAGRRQIVTRADVFALYDGKEKLIATGTGTILPVNPS
jgi:uncharacterized protein (TIGR00369 family)